ncbi:hypothetical protein ACFOGJ_26740 [Marinibaculum pumilum]|uniref:Uncharacterized protein n=1 Tax=Marinibaculum pumilum TaxID=1766165 RepID=A0ABV7L8Y8_9PROT
MTASVLAMALGLSACGGNVITRWSTVWVDVRPNPTALEVAKADCAAAAERPDAADDAMAYCMERHGWVAMQDPLLK